MTTDVFLPSPDLAMSAEALERWIQRLGLQDALTIINMAERNGLTVLTK
jgi:hypothetical protein